jgi:valyl-tRNA synthetase
LIDGIERKLANPSFVDKAPKEVVEKEREKQQNITMNMGKLKVSLESLG